MILRARRFGGRNFAVGMKCFLRTDRCEHNRRSPGRAQEPHRHVDLADIDHPVRSNFQVRETLTIGAHRSIVVDARSEISKVGRRQNLARDRLEIHHVKSLVGTGDEILAHRNSLQSFMSALVICGMQRQHFGERPVNQATADQERTRREKTQKLATRLDVVFVAFHTQSSSFRSQY